MKITHHEYALGFKDLLCQLFSCEHLHLLHRKTSKRYDLFKVGADSITELHDAFYNEYRKGWPAFVALYNEFISEVVASNQSESFLYQSFPNLRLHYPQNVAVGKFHSDSEFGHPAHEQNYILPLTMSEGTASVWVESKQGKKDYRAMDLRPGVLIQFDGNVLSHGNKINTTGMTRVSLDFRTLPLSKYNPDFEGESITRKTKFKLGEYYSLHEL